MRKIIKRIGITLTALLVAGVIFAGGAFANEVWAGRGNAIKTESNITLVGEMFNRKNEKISGLKSDIGDKEKALAQKDQEKQKEVAEKQKEVDKKQEEVNKKQEEVNKANQDLETYKQNQSNRVSKLEEQLRQAKADVESIDRNLQGVIDRDAQNFKE